ncbi:exodeoxyribonuclease V subunit gamma [Luteimonas aquatica]|uniref:exodeoxyribonuclease V subunit gamma n=1 Tax=Luteimonas aquatica TaxID=450364 RepID=UPI001F598DA1|nr:exodeoxyribonuclease V subunit gamma [Luteimonas aquatica]
MPESRGHSGGFRLIHSNALDVLAAVLAERLRASPADGDWLRPETVLVPQYSMRRWLQQFLAEHSGICANVRFLTPGEFVDAALDANLGRVAPAERLRPEALRWHLLRELRARPPAEYARLVADGRKAWSLACALAETFEKYQAWRRDLLLRWEAGADADDAQAQLWRRIARGRAHRARRIGEYLQRYAGEGAAVPRLLPPRLFVFACQNVSPDVLQLIASQARAGEQDFFLHTPSRAYWGDLARWSHAYLPSDDLDAHRLDAHGAEADADRHNPLLAAWGQAERDFIAALGGGETVRARYEAQAFVEPSHATLLGRMQADVLDNRAPLLENADARWPRTHVARGDASLQFHACHTRLREVQVLHDQLRALLEAPAEEGMPRLDPRDIAVLAPDIDAYAPHIEAVFGGALGTARELPYTIADTSPLAGEPLAEAFLRLLDLPLRPLRLADLLDLLAVPAIARRFDLDDGARASLQVWLEAAGARWALDGADRARAGAADEAAYTLQFALERLLLGYAADEQEEIAGVAPWPALEGQSTQALDGCLRLVALLREAAAALTGPHSPREWAARLDRLLDGVFGADDAPPEAAGDRRSLDRLRQAVAAFAAGAEEAEFAAPVAHALLRDRLLADLGAADARAPFLSGGVCFGRMVPMRLIPFRVICLLGLDDGDGASGGTFPARETRDPLNRIQQALETPQRRVGDPSRRDADRYLFLQLFNSAARVFYLSWVGFDARDGSAREPSTLVDELLETAARYHAGPADAVRRELVVRHALQPFSPAAFGAAHVDEREGDRRRFSFDARWRIAAVEDEAVEGASTRTPVFADGVLPRASLQEARDEIDLEQLRRALARPQAAYLREGLGLRLAEDVPPLLEHEPLGLPDALQQHALRQGIFEHWLHAGAAPDPASLHAALVARARLAPGADGLATLALLIEAVRPFAEAALAAGFSGAGETARFAQPQWALGADGAARLRGSLAGRHPQGFLRAALNPGGLHGAHVLRHRLDALAAACLPEPAQVFELAIAGKGEGPRVAPLPMPEPKQAARTLRALLALRARMLRAPLPFLPKSGYAFYGARDEAAGLNAARAQWLGNGFGIPGEADAATQLALRGRDPFADADAQALQAFVGISRALFGALIDGDSAGVEALP